ncbi:hypothetical protein IF1G_11393 [Cordyceps javanica]|uniref:Uncharacterized protein n=1 Tax=Cordyceps javanica TaxID=43265 RepID=A0A545UKF3_9HYPO|nr:hypothetical protein IF1G_11393 [Cordyceps javanica]
MLAFVISFFFYFFFSAFLVIFAPLAVRKHCRLLSSERDEYNAVAPRDTIRSERLQRVGRNTVIFQPAFTVYSLTLMDRGRSQIHVRASNSSNLISILM